MNHNKYIRIVRFFRCQNRVPCSVHFLFNGPPSHNLLHWKFSLVHRQISPSFFILDFSYFPSSQPAMTLCDGRALIAYSLCPDSRPCPVSTFQNFFFFHNLKKAKNKKTKAIHGRVISCTRKCVSIFTTSNFFPFEI